MPFTLQDLIKAVEKAKIEIWYVVDVIYGSRIKESKQVIDADILLAELRKMEE